MMSFFFKRALFFFLVIYPFMGQIKAFSQESLVPFLQNAVPEGKDIDHDEGELSLPTSLRFITSVDFEKFNYISRSGYLMGYNVDLIRALCKELSLEKQCFVQTLPFHELIPHLLTGEADAIIAGVKPSKSMEDVAFTQAYLKIPGRFLTLKENHFPHYDRKKMHDKTIGVLKGTLHEKILKDYFSIEKISPYETPKALYDALLRKDIFAIFSDGLSLSHFLESDEGDRCCRFSDGPYYLDKYGFRIAYARENAALGKVLNRALKGLEDKNILQELYMRHFPVGFYR